MILSNLTPLLIHPSYSDHHTGIGDKNPLTGTVPTDSVAEPVGTGAGWNRSRFEGPAPPSEKK